MKKSSISKLDKNFAARVAEDGLVWHDLAGFPLEGRGWEDVKRRYDRLPARAEGLVRDAVWQLGQHSAGMSIRFVTDARRLAARWTVRFPELALPHMAATGVSGLDVYVRQGGRWRWMATGVPDKFPTTEVTLAPELPAGRREYRVYLPLYNGLESVAIGVEAGAEFGPGRPWPRRTERPICFYGTSITQGGCASRPGLAYPSILGRRLARPILNLGFSGNGKAEPEVTALLAELDPAVFVMDCMPNLRLPDMEQRLEEWVEELRRARPRTPLVLVGNMRFQGEPYDTRGARKSRAANVILRRVVARLRRRGLGGLYVVPGGTLLGDDFEGTVDGGHPNDLGFMRMADALEPVLRRLVANEA
jgi:lysophospholipase L1-like esterase